ncbi:MAG TPA: hypothetical protein VNG90_03660, partial [Candidatus Acidoferrum sp.]|nr:hypothetical protein [Candidatus Acidoferrum sp.]
VLIGTGVGVIAAGGYLIDTLRGKVRPNRVSFFMWSVAPAIAFAAEIGQGVGLVSLQTLNQAILPFLVLLASFVNKKAEWKITKFDLICGALSVVGLTLWLVTKVGNVAIAFSIMADGLAALPTIIKAYKHPESEIAWPWFVTAVGMLISLLTITHWTFANYGFILYLLVCNAFIASFARFRPKHVAVEVADSLAPTREAEKV